MSVKIIRPNERVNYNVELRKVRIEFNDGTHMMGLINIHSKFVDIDKEDIDYNFSSINDPKFKFRRTSDYLKDCTQNEGMITVFNASYDGREDRVCFVLLHSVKFITEEREERTKTGAKPEPKKEEIQQEKTGLSLRDRLKKLE